MKIVILIASLFQLINFCLTKYVMNEKNEMIQIFDVSISSSLQKIPQIFLLNAKAIKLASLKERDLKIKEKEFVEADELGLFLGKTPNSETLDPIHHKYLRNEKNRVWLPYSYASEWKGVFNPNGTSIITNQLKRTSASKKETPLVTIQFQYDKDWEIISSSELNQIVAWLNENTNKRNNIKTLLKLKIKQASLNYTQSKRQLDETKARKTSTENSVKNNLKAVADTENIIKGLLADLEKAENELAINAKSVSDS